MRGHTTEDGRREKGNGKRFLPSTIYRLPSTVYFFLLASCIPLYGAFENFSVSPRILAMGGASVAISDDASAVNANPAGLVQIEKNELLATYCGIYNADGLYHGYLAAAFPSVGNALGISWSRLSLPAIYDEDVMTAAFARQLSDNLSAGLSVRIFSSEVYDFDYAFYNGRKYAAGYGVGILYQITDNWLAGVVGENLNSPQISAGETLSPDFKIGMRYHPFESGLILAEFRSLSKSVSFGFEVIVGEILPVRLGLNNMRPSFGVGIIYKYLTFDFAVLSDNNLGLLPQMGMRIRI